MKRLVSRGFLMIDSTMVVLADVVGAIFAQTPDKPAPSRMTALFRLRVDEAFFKRLGRIEGKHARGLPSDSPFRTWSQMSSDERRTQ